jgi:hypothetical protein
MKKRSLLLSVVAALGFTTANMAQVPNYVPTNGLVGWWPFNGNANDESGTGDNGYNFNTALIEDRFENCNSAYYFNGVDSYISLNNSHINSYSYSAWVKFYDIQDTSMIFCKGFYCNYPDESYATYKAAGDFWIRRSNLQYTYEINTAVTFTDSTWHHIVVTYDQTITNFYLDGILMVSGIPQGTLRTSSVNKMIGNSPCFSEAFWGVIDDVGLWNRALNQNEISQLFLANSTYNYVTIQPASQFVNISSGALFIVGSSDPGATYQWQTDLGVGFQNLNSVGQYSGTTNDTLTVSNVTMSNNNQPFRCIVSSGSCSDTSNVAVLTVNNNVGINETSQDKLFSVFPTPAQSIINVKADSKLIGSVYSIYDNTGRVVLTGKLNSQSTTIELGNLSGGIYMFSVGENMKQTFKVIKE